jgi:CP family cyanate transporter-like MFS transporter
MQAYISFGWFALYFRERAGASATRAGLYVAVLAAVAVPVSAVVPAVAARFPDQRRVLAGLVVCYVAAYTGMAVSPGGAPLLWMVLAGLGGGTFPLALTMIGLRTRTTAGTASTSAFAQSVGYVIAGVGPLLVGVLHGATGGWTWPFVLLFADLVLMSVAGWYAAQPRYVEDDLRE